METRKERRAKEKTHWSLDRHIPIAGILALILQTAGIVWWASGMDARVTSIEQNTKTWQETRHTLPERIARVEATLESINASLIRIERSLEKRK